MSFEMPLFNVGNQVASVDLSSYQYRLMKLGASGLALCGAGESVFGSLQDKPTSGMVGNVACLGISLVMAGGTVAKGDKLASDSTGRAIVATSGASVFGQAMAGGAVGEYIPVFLSGEYAVLAARAASVAAIGTTANLTALVPTAVDLNAVFSDTEVEAALLAKADNADVETLRTEVEGRLDAIETKVDAVIAALKAAGLMAV